MRHRLPLLVPVTIVTLFSSLAAFSQACPIKTGDYELQYARPDTNTFKCSNDVNTSGYTRCTLSCTYKRPAEREINSFSIYFEYIAPNAMSQNFVGSRFMCKQDSTDGKNRQDVQVLALPEYVNSQLEQSAADQVTNTVFRQLENVAAKCPNAAPLPPPVAQSAAICPDRSGAFYRWNPKALFRQPIDDEPDCDQDNDGNTFCRHSCSYRDSTNAGSNLFALVLSWTKTYGRGRLSDRAFCVLAPNATWVAHRDKQAAVHFDGVESPVESAAATDLSKRIIDVIAPNAAACPAPQAAPSTCADKLKRFQEIKKKDRLIKAEIDELDRREETLAMLRRNFDNSNEVIKAIKDPSYRGPGREILDQLNSDEKALTRLRAAAFWSTATDLLGIVTDLRDSYGAEIDYFSKARERQTELVAKKVALDVEEKLLRGKINRASCFRNEGDQACDLDGSWVFTIAPRADDASSRRAIWSFEPSGDNIFRATDNGNGFYGSSESFGRWTLLSFRGPELRGYYELNFNAACTQATGTLTYIGTGKTTGVTVQRSF